MDLQCVQTRCFSIFSQQTFTYLIYWVLKATVAEVRLLTWSKDCDLAHYQHFLGGWLGESVRGNTSN